MARRKNKFKTKSPLVLAFSGNFTDAFKHFLVRVSRQYFFIELCDTQVERNTAIDLIKRSARGRSCMVNASCMHHINKVAHDAIA